MCSIFSTYKLNHQLLKIAYRYILSYNIISRAIFMLSNTFFIYDDKLKKLHHVLDII